MLPMHLSCLEEKIHEGKVVEFADLLAGDALLALDLRGVFIHASACVIHRE